MEKYCASLVGQMSLPYVQFQSVRLKEGLVSMETVLIHSLVIVKWDGELVALECIYRWFSVHSCVIPSLVIFK